jgi:hypothetical protein
MGSIVVLCVVSIATAALAAVVAIYCCFVCRAVQAKHSTSSLRGELDELHDSIGKHSALLKRINARTVMQERRAVAGEQPSDDSAQAPGESAAAWKARMRARLIVPGRPAQHR